MSRVENVRIKKRVWRVGKFSNGSYAASELREKKLLMMTEFWLVGWSGWVDAQDDFTPIGLVRGSAARTQSGLGSSGRLK